MKNFLYLLGGVAAATACFLLTRPRTAPRSVDELAHKLQDAWADHHTIA